MLLINMQSLQYETEEVADAESNLRVLNELKTTLRTQPMRSNHIEGY